MKVKITKDVARHRANERYQCLLVQFEETDTNFFVNEMNWMPRDDELMLIIRLLYCLSPTFKNKLRQFIKIMEA